MNTRIEDITNEQAAWAIERFAQWVASTPGVWAVTVADARWGRTDVNLHLIVQVDLAEVDPEDAERAGWAVT